MEYGLWLMRAQQFDVVIVGAGFGGIGAAIQLNRLGYDDIVIVEREDGLGGTWGSLGGFVTMSTSKKVA